MFVKSFMNSKLDHNAGNITMLRQNNRVLSGHKSIVNSLGPSDAYVRQ